MGVFLMVAFLVLIGPLSYLYGADSRRQTDRGWVGERRSLRPLRAEVPTGFEDTHLQRV